MSKEEIEIRIHGRVQGVRFRQMAARKAHTLGVVGYVMNRAEGGVEMVGQGSRERLWELLHWVENSPGLTRVESVQYHWRPPSRVFSVFHIVKDAGFISDQVTSFFNLGKTLLRKRDRVRAVHVAIIPDGNRRWARRHGQEPHFGHYTSASFQHLQELFDAAQHAGVRYLSLWGFSTENWKRGKGEREALFGLLEEGVKRLRRDAAAHQIRFRHLGRKDRLPPSLLRELTFLEEESACYTRFHVQLCLDYGGADEIVRATNALLRAGVKEIDERALLAHLDAPDLPPVDLVIRTSGEQRTSGLMPLQAAYAELYFAPVHFPDFTAEELRKALEEFGKRKRRFGG